MPSRLHLPVPATTNFDQELLLTAEMQSGKYNKDVLSWSVLGLEVYIPGSLNTLNNTY